MKLKLNLGTLAVSLILFTVHPTASKQAQQGHNLTIVYTNDVLGEIEPCG